MLIIEEAGHLELVGGVWREVNETSAMTLTMVKREDHHRQKALQIFHFRIEIVNI